MKKFLYAALLMLIAAQCQAQPLRIVDSFKVGGAGRWDYISLQPNSNRLFVSHGTQVNVLDKINGDSLGIIPNTIGVHGIAFVPSLNKGYTSNGKLDNVTVFDLNTLAVKDSIATGKNPDAIFYDAYSKKVITCNGRSNDISFIDPVTDKVVATVAAGGKPETAVSNNAGRIFVNIEDKNEIIVINTNTLKIDARWSLLPGEGPAGLAIDINTKRLFAGCGDNSKLIIIDAEKGTIIDKFTIGAHCDGTCFDSTLKNIYASNGDGTLSVIHEDSKDKFTALPAIITRKGARTMTVDQQSHRLYLPAAKPGPAIAGERPGMIPGTFKILVVDK